MISIYQSDDGRVTEIDSIQPGSWIHPVSYTHLQEDERLVYGKNPVAELLKSGSGVDTVFLADTLPPAVAGYYMALAKEAGAVAKQVRAAKLRSICGVDSHQGVAAFAASVEYATLDDLLQRAADQQHAPFLVLADGVEDPHNLGAIIRSALLCGADGVVIPKRGGAAITPTVMKASAGGAARLPVARVANIGETVRRLKEQNVFVSVSYTHLDVYKRQTCCAIAVLLYSNCVILIKN